LGKFKAKNKKTSTKGLLGENLRGGGGKKNIFFLATRFFYGDAPPFGFF